MMPHLNSKQVKGCHIAIVLSEIGTVIVYFLSIIFLGSIIETSKFTPYFLFKVFVVTAAAWLPTVLIDFIYHLFFPSKLDKLKQEAKSKILIQKSRGSTLASKIQVKMERPSSK